MVKLDSEIGKKIRSLITYYNEQKGKIESANFTNINKNEYFTEEEINNVSFFFDKSGMGFKYFDFKINYNELLSKKDINLSWLKNLVINGDCPISKDQFFDLLLKMTDIENLRLRKSNFINNDNLNLFLTGFPELKKLDISYQNNINMLNLANNKKIKDLFIKSNISLGKIYGLENLNLDFFSFFDNPSYINESEIINFVLNLYSSEIDVVYFPNLVNIVGNNKKLQEKAKNIYFAESINLEYFSYLKYPYSVVNDVYNRAKKIIDTYILDGDSDIQKFSIVYQWLCDNIKYDYDKYKNGKDIGIKNGSNGLINGFIHKKVVCEGYVKMAQFLLKLCNLPSHSIMNLAGINNTGHCILGIPLGNAYYYSDITFDAESYQNDQERKYFLLSKKDIQKDHKLLFEKNRISFNDSLSLEESKEILEFAINRIKIVNQIEETYEINLNKMDSFDISELIKQIRKQINLHSINYQLGNSMILFLEKKLATLIQKENISKVNNEKSNAQSTKKTESFFDKMLPSKNNMQEDNDNIERKYQNYRKNTQNLKLDEKQVLIMNILEKKTIEGISDTFIDTLNNMSLEQLTMFKQTSEEVVEENRLNVK